MMLLHLRLLAIVIWLVPSAFAAAAASSSIKIPANFSHVSSPDFVQVANGGLPQKDKMPTQWQGRATIEVYMGSDYLNNVGYVTGTMLYDLVQRTLRKDCPHTVGGQSYKKCWGLWHSFDTRYREDSGRVATTKDQIHVKSSHYGNQQIRNLLIGSLAAAYEASTNLTRNCYYARDSEAGYRYCNVPVQVGAYTEDSHIFIELTSDIIDDNDGSWHCCETRELVDARLDELMDEFKSVYPASRSKGRDVGCHLGCREDQRESNIDVDKILAELKKIWL